MLQTGQGCTRGFRRLLQIIFDLHNARNRLTRLPEKLQTHGARVFWHAVQHPTRRGNQPVRALFLHARQTGEEFIGDIFAQADLAEGMPGNFQGLAAQFGFAIGRKTHQFKCGKLGIMDFAHIVIQTRDLQPIAFRIDHRPARQIIQRRTPKHRLFTARVHRHIAADAGRIRAGRVHRKHQARTLGRLSHAARHRARAGQNRIDFVRHHAAAPFFDRLNLNQFFGIDHHRTRVQRHCAAGVARATATRNDGHIQINRGFDQARHLRLGVGREHDKRILDAPVGRVGHVRYARQTIEFDIAFGGIFAKFAAHLRTQFAHFVKLLGKMRHRNLGFDHQSLHLFGALIAFQISIDRQIGHAAFFNLVQTVIQRLDQRLASARIVQQIILQIGIAVDHPDIAQDFVQHARRTPRAPLGT